MYYDLSAKYNYNYEKPFLFLLKRLFNDINLSFTQKLHVCAPEGLMNEAQKNYVENELHQANSMFLPSDDDDI
jgi:GTP-binding nuclear protein Ran